MRLRTEVLSVLAAGLLSGCLYEGVPVVVTPIAEKPRLEIRSDQPLASIKFDRVLFNLRRGDVVGQYTDSLFDHCYPFVQNAYWSSGRIVVTDRDLESLFFEAMKESNFNIVGDPTRLFQVTDSSEPKRPDYLIGARVEQIKMRVCDKFRFSQSADGFARPVARGFRTGQASMRVRWQVFDVLNRKVVHEFVTEGYTNLTENLPDGETRLIQDAFAAAARNLAGEPAFVAGLALPVDGPADIAKSDRTPILIERLAPSEQTITDNIDIVRQAVVTLDAGQSHGSGFFIAPNLILTNNHVVEGIKFIKVRLVTERILLGEVVRTHPARDVALVQVESVGVRPLAVRLDPLQITEEVYAIGSPLDKRFAGTVTKGIVSRFDRNARGLEDIQADVDIQGGNSGGSLLDKNGNVVGVSYAGIGPPGSGMSIGLNFFIPIADALQKLNVKFSERATRR